MSAMWPCVVEGRTRPRAASASLMRPVLMPAPVTISRASAASIFASMASMPAGKPTSTTAWPVTAPLPERSSGSVGRCTPARSQRTSEMSACSAWLSTLQLERPLLAREEGAQHRLLRGVAALGERLRVLVAPPRLGDVAVRQHQAAAVDQEAGAHVFDLVDRALALGVDERPVVGVLERVAVVVELVAQRPALRVAEEIGALDQAHPRAVVAHDALAHRALGLERREARARRLQLAAQRPGFRFRGRPDLRVERLLALAQLLEPGRERLPVRVRARASVRDARREARALGLRFAERLAQALDLAPELAVLELAVAERCQREPEADRDQPAHRRGDLGEAPRDERARRRERALALPGRGLEHLLPGVVAGLEPQARAALAELDHVALAQHRLAHVLARQPQHQARFGHLQHDLAVPLEDTGVVCRGALAADVGLARGADEHRQPDVVEPVPVLAVEVSEADADVHRAPLRALASGSTPGAPIRRSTLAWARSAHAEAPMRTYTSTRGSLKPGERRMSLGSAGDW